MKSKSKKIILIVTIVTMFVLIAVAAFIYFATDTMKTPQEMFQKYLGKTVVIADSNINDNNDLVKNYIAKAYSNSYEKDITTSIEGKGKNIPQDLNKVNLKFDEKYNKEQENKSVNLAINYDQEKMFSTTYVEDKDKIALSLPEVLNKYLSVNKSEYKDFLNKMGISANVNENSKVNLSELLNITDDQLSTLNNTYLSAISSSIPASAYTKQRKVNTMINDQYVEVKTYTLNLTNEQLNNCVKNILVTAKDDAFLATLIQNKAGALGIQDLKTEDIQNKIQSMIDDADKKIQNESNPSDEAIKVVLYVEGSNIRKLDLNIDDNTYVITILKNTNNDFMININAQKKENEQSEKIIGYSIDLEKVVSDKSFEISTVIANTNNESNDITVNSKFALTMNSDDEFKNEMKIDFNNNDNNYKVLVNGTTKFTNDVKMDEVSKDDCVDLNVYSKDQIVSLESAILTRIENIYKEKREQILFSNNENTNNIKCEQITDLSVTPEDKDKIMQAIQQRGYFMYENGNKNYLVISSGVKSKGGYVLNLGPIKTKGTNLEINVIEEYVDEYSKDENPITYPFIVLELSEKPSYLLVRNDELRYQFQEIDLNANVNSNNGDQQ